MSNLTVDGTSRAVVHYTAVHSTSSYTVSLAFVSAFLWFLIENLNSVGRRIDRTFQAVCLSVCPELAKLKNE